MKNSDKAAFATVPARRDEVIDNMQIIEQCHGLTKREYFAGEAMRGMLSCDKAGVDATIWWKRILRIFFPSYVTSKWAGSDYSGIAKASITYADELLKQLEPKKY